MVALVVSFLVALILTIVVIRVSARHLHVSGDHDFSSPQKFHAKPVPRIGGLGIFLGIVVSLTLVFFKVIPHEMLPGDEWLGALLLVCSLPAFLAGLTEDVTKTQSPSRRLMFTAISALLGTLLINATINHTDIPGLDWIVSWRLGAILVTIFVVSGVVNAVNIIDGFNGLAAMCVILMLSAVGYVSYQVGDTSVFMLTLITIGAVVGFFLLNFPAGMIFLGDGGAYLLGFLVAELGILVIARNAQVSPLFPLMICIYPVFETIFSIYRKKHLRGMSPGVPDGVHLHMLVFKRLVRIGLGTESVRKRTKRNSLTSPYLWGVCLISVTPAVLWWNNTKALAICIVAFGVFYTYFYWTIVRFRTPSWLVLRSKKR